MLADERSAVEDSAAALDVDTAAAGLSSAAAAAAAECVLEHPASHITEQSHFKVGDTYSLKTKMKLSVQSHYL